MSIGGLVANFGDFKHGFSFFFCASFAGLYLAGGATVLTGARILDGTGKAPLENGVLVFKGDRILYVGPADTVQRPADAKVIDARGKTIIPGLISAHSHLGLCNGVLGPRSENYTRENVQHQLEQYERYGVLTVMSLGVNKDVLYEWRNEQLKGELAGADIFTADRGLGVRQGAPPFPLLEFKVAAHIFNLDDAKALLKAGIDVIAHSVRDQPVDAEFIQAMKANDAVYIPTLDLDESQYIYAEHPAWMQESFFTQAVDINLLNRWKSPLYAKEMAVNPNTVKNKAAAAMGQRNVKILFDAGVKIAFGTDSGALPTRVQGFAEHRELQLLVQAGLSPMDAIVCATKNSAEVIGAADRGTLEVGKRADFLILDGNPLDDIRNTTHIDSIYHRGKIVGGP